MRTVFAILVFLAVSATARAQEFHFDGYADLRLIVPSTQGTWEDGELGKTRFGDEDGTVEARLAEVVGQGLVEITPELMVLAAARIDPYEKNFFDVLEGYVRYRPVSTTAWRWSIKAGAFFPPISLENTEVGWTSPWTLTPSAINSWVGEELRTIGGEARLEWRSDQRTITASAAGFGWNDPAGVLLADRGWTLDDRTVGLIQDPHLPDVIAYERHLPEPIFTPEFMEIDGRPGWYAGASWDETGLGHFDVLYYNNEADPTKIVSDVVAWRTSFWNAGVKTTVGPVTFLAQGHDRQHADRTEPVLHQQHQLLRRLSAGRLGHRRRLAAGRPSGCVLDRSNRYPAFARRQRTWQRTDLRGELSAL